MIIKSLELMDYRNYEVLTIEFDKGTNILYGDNAQGKTNILEAIYLAATTKSHKGSKDKEVIHFNEDESHIRMKIHKEIMDYQIDIHQSISISDVGDFPIEHFFNTPFTHHIKISTFMVFT